LAGTTRAGQDNCRQAAVCGLYAKSRSSASAEPFVGGPKQAGIDQTRSQQVNVDQPNSASHQGTPLKKQKDLWIVQFPRTRHSLHQINDLPPILKVAAGDFTYNKRMYKHLIFVQQLRQ
jgi:hypothetical protein